MKKAFSLIELLVTLIIMSLLFSAFSPVIIKKLKASDITVGSFNNNEGRVITCKEGYHELNNKCALDIENCINYDNLNNCILCNSGYKVSNNVCYKIIDNCKTQAGNKCSVCEDGYTLSNNLCLLSNCYDFFCDVCTTTNNGSCSVCKEGYILHQGKCYFGNLEGCNNPSYDDTYQRINCASCATGYTKCNSGSCRLTTKLDTVCPTHTIKIGCSCVMQYNIGDGKYGENLSTVKTCTAGSNCSVINGQSYTTDARALEAACWKGTTAASSCNSNYGGYSGCTRTLCNWKGAYEMCNSIGWRLPTMPELQQIASSTYSNSTLAANGLMFCSVGSNVAKCDEGVGLCVGALGNNCYSYHIWSSSFNKTNNTDFAYDRYMGAQWYDYSYYLTTAMSARCVKDL